MIVFEHGSTWSSRELVLQTSALPHIELCANASLPSSIKMV
jgi:hypothetical protein